MKRLVVFLLFLGAIVTSCVNFTVKTDSVNSTIVDPENRQDTVFLGYILGQPTKSITTSLIKNGQFSTSFPVRKTYTISLGGYSQDVVTAGYPFDLYIGDQHYDATLVLYDTDEKIILDDAPLSALGLDINQDTEEAKLMRMQIYIKGTNSYPIVSALESQYGKPNTPPKDGYKVLVPQELDAFWNVSNKAVYLETFSSFMVLVYEDIIAIQDRNNGISAVKEAVREQERQHNLEQSKNTKL